jgi:pimeloyl-ACP methyl ester carboxylesterase
MSESNPSATVEGYGTVRRIVMVLEMTIVLVHGAWHGAWCWERVIPLLDAAGELSLAIDLPSVSSSDARLRDDAACVHDALDALTDPAVLVGHSYGGAVVTEAGAHQNVAHLVYLTAFALEVGESPGVNELSGGEGGSALDAAIRVEGRALTLDPELVIPALYNDCEPEIAQAAVARLRPQSLAALRDTVTVAAWHEKPATYVVCTDDRGVVPDLQRSAAARIGNSIDWPTGHSPFLSRPDLVADLLVELSSR